MPDPGALSVHGPGMGGAPPIGQVQGLMAQAYPQDGSMGMAEDDIQAVADVSGPGRMARPGGDHNPPGLQPLHLRQTDLIGEDDGVIIKDGDIIHQVPDEGVVIVHKEDRPHAVTPRALFMAAIFLSVSKNSFSGSESTTIPAPACTVATPS